MHPETPSFQPQETTQRGPKFQDLVSEEVHAETRERIFRLQEDITSLQYQEYLAKPENQDLINQTTQMSFAQRVKFREILIIAKLWLIQGSDRDFVRVNESIADMQSDVDTGLLDENGDFREGVLPFFNRLNVTANADFRTSNGRSLNQFSSISASRIESVDLDFSVQPLINFQYETPEGEQQNTKFLRVKNAYDSEGNFIEVRNVYVNVSSLQSLYPIEKYQSRFDFTQENLSNLIKTRLDRGHIHFFRDSIDMIKDRLEPAEFRELITKLRELIDRKIDEDSLYLLENLSVVNQVYGDQSREKCTKIVKNALTMDIGYHFVLPHLSSIFQYCGHGVCVEIIDEAINNDYHEELLANLSSIKDVYAYSGMSKCKEIVDKAIDEKLYSSLLLNLASINNVYGEFGFFKCNEILEFLILEKEYDLLFSNLSMIKNVYGDYGISRCDKIIDLYLDEEGYRTLLSNLSFVKDAYGDNGISKCIEIVDAALAEDAYYGLLSNLAVIKEIFEPQGEQKCKQIVDAALADKQYTSLVSNLVAIKEIFGPRGEQKCYEIIDAAIDGSYFSSFVSVNHYPSLLRNLAVIKETFETQGEQKCKQIVDAAIANNQYPSLLRNLAVIKEIFEPQGEQKCKQIVDATLGNESLYFSLRELRVIKEVFGPQGEQKCKQIIDTALDDKEHSSLLSNLVAIKEIFGPRGEQKCKRIIDAVIADKDYESLLAGLGVIKEVFGSQGLQQCKQIVDAAIANKDYESLFDELKEIKELFEPQGLQQCKQIVDAAIGDRKYERLLDELEVIEEVFGSQGLQQCKQIVDAAIADGEYARLLRGLYSIKEVYAARGLAECQRVINLIITENQFESIIMNLESIEDVFEGSNINWLYPIVQSFFIEKQFMLLFAFKDTMEPFLSNEQKTELVRQCLRLDFNHLSYLMSYQRSETTKIIIDNLDEFIIQNFEAFKSLISLESTFALSLLKHLDVLESTLASNSELSSVLESIVEVSLMSGNVDVLFKHYSKLSVLYPKLRDLILEDYIVLLEHYKEIPDDISIDIISTCLDIALVKRDYASLLTYIQLPEFRFFVTEMSADDDAGIINTLLSIEVPADAKVFNTPDGFEIVNHNYTRVNSIPDMTVRILRYNHDLQLRDEITNIENDCLELEELGINYYNHLVRPYAYLRNIIDSRAAFERRDKTFFENKRFNVTFYPQADWNKAFNYPQSRYDKNQNNLYFEVSSEREFFDTMRELEEFGVHINLLEIGGHGSQGSLSFGGADSRLNDTSQEHDELQLSLEDEQDLLNLGELEVLRGSDILLDSCSNAKTELVSKKQLEMGSSFINMARMISGTIGCNSRVISSRVPRPIVNVLYRFGQYYYGFDDLPIFAQDNRPSLPAYNFYAKQITEGEEENL